MSLALSVQRELAIREQLWPREVAAQRASQAEADADCEAWRELLALAGSGSVACQDGEQPLDTLDRLYARVAEAQERRAAACEAVPTDDQRRASREQRLADTVAVRRHLERIGHRFGDHTLWQRHLGTTPVLLEQAA